MRFRTGFGVLLISGTILAAAGCQSETSNTNAEKPSPSPARREAAPLPLGGFKAQITMSDPMTKLRVGQKETIRVKIKNASEVPWYARGGELNTKPDNRFYLAAGNRWLKSDGKKLVTNMDGRYGLQRDLKPGQEEEVPLQITAPSEPGEYILEVDLVQEQVAWFSEKGSPTARAKVTVVR